MSLITFEGGDGAGKTTLIESLYQTLKARGRRVLKTRAPGATPAGQAIRALLLNQGEIPLSPRCELLLFLADRAEHVQQVIRPALERGEIVLCDRYNDSTIAYQGAGRKLGVEEVSRLCEFASHGLHPSLTLYLDLDPVIGLERVRAAGQEKDRIEAEALRFHQEVRNAFLEIAKRQPQRFRVIQASQPREKVFEDALRIIDACAL